MPSFVFARASHLDRLALLEERPGSHEPFSLFRYFGRLPLVSDEDLEPLRSAENQAAPKRRRRTFGAGQSVRISEGICGGMMGRVERTDGNYTLVCFGGNIRVKISTFLLRLDVAEGQHSIAA